METQCFRLLGAIDSACRPGHFRRHDRLVHRHARRPSAPPVERDPAGPVVLCPTAWRRQSNTTVRETDTLQHVCIAGSGIVTHRHGSRCQNRAPWASRVSAPSVARNHESRRTWFGHVPVDVARQTELQPAPTRPVGNATNNVARTSWFGVVIAVLRQRGLRLLPVFWRIPRQRKPLDEAAIASLGSVEIRRMPAACFVGTCVHGEQAQARDTGLQRLRRYLNGENRGSVVLRAERPVIQQQLGPQLWRISVRMVGDDVIAPAPRAPKVKLWSMPPGWLAIVRMSGRAIYSAVASGDARVLDAIANADWVATGTPMIRLQASGPMQWITGGFEVAVPVAPHCHGDMRSNTDFAIEERLPAG
jgi:hypothetical protein